MSKLVDDIKALLALGVTQTEIAEASGVSRATICRFLAGKHCPSYFRAMQIRRAVDVLGQTVRPPSGGAAADTCAEAGR